MTNIRKQRDIIDRKALASELDELVSWSGYSTQTRMKVLGIFKKALAKGKDEVRRRLEAREANGMDTVRANAFLIDQILRVLYDFAERYVYPLPNPTKGQVISLLAIGGYGRRTLAPQSDIDIMFLLPYKQTPQIEQIVEFILYLLWDMGLKVGHSTRTIDECVRLSKADQTIRTALLDARWLWGDQKLFEEFKRRYQKDIVEGSGADFVEAKLGERDMRHEKMGDTRYVLEPNIKDGKGGLRDLQTLFWMSRYLYGISEISELVEQEILTKDDARRFRKAENFLWTVRCHLHYMAGRPEERLTFDVQTAIAEQLNYQDRKAGKGVERFMKHYFLMAKEVGDLTRLLCAVLEEQHKKRGRGFWAALNLFAKKPPEGFKLDADRITVEHDDVFDEKPARLIQLFREAQIADLDIHPHALRLVHQKLGLINTKLRKDEEANRLFLDILTSDQKPSQILLRMNEAGLFGKFIPDFGRVVAQMQYDMYHVYTVDEHTIRAIRYLERIDAGRHIEDMPISSKVIKEVVSRRALYVAVLMHDIAKGRGGDHSELGAEVALKLGPRLGLTDEETETVSWLVRHHLAMSHIAFKRDVNDPKTISDFAELVQSPERLKLLLLLTVVDIRAVGPGRWNAWKAGLLRDLYNVTMERLTGDFKTAKRDVRVEHAKQALRERLSEWPPALIEDYVDSGSPSFWLSYDTETHARYAAVVRKAKEDGAEIHIDTRLLPEFDATEITVYTQDHPGLFSRIAGAMALSGASIVEARIVTLNDGMALDTFVIQDSQHKTFDSEVQLKRLKERIEGALKGTLYPARELEEAKKSILPSRTKVFTVAPRVLVDNTASRTRTVIEVNGRDRLGFLHDVTAALTALGLQISAARIATYGERAIDVFYVKDVFGLKIDSDSKTEAIRQKILQVITEPDPPKKKRKGKAA